ncbi:SIMPL domain-containing protein [Pseudogemmobacter bohemicus]|uniref:SIMPL domain-containing protein n=1 Tax=Pseudogemmobacter bohemicus TaxID=2250708 RepID=UPI000DD46DA4|nr:SIMPL domain-containing protein [Pseudogemmobacter bohemicus]
MRMRSFFRITLSAAAFGAALAAASPLLAEGRALITVNGEASISRAPDMATISIGVTTVGASAGEALKLNSTDMEKVIARLKEAGIAEGDMQTSGLSVNPNWANSYSSSGAQKIDGFTAMNYLTVGIRDLGKLGEVLDQVVADGANTLNGVNFALIDPRPALDEARKLAVADARARAELLAGASGVKLGDLVSITDGGGFNGGPAPMFKAEAASVPVQRGEVSYQANVTISWEIAD